MLCIPAQPTDEEISSCTDEEKKVVHVESVTVVDDSSPNLLNIFWVSWYQHLDRLLNQISLLKRMADVLMKRKPKFKICTFIRSHERRASLIHLTIDVQKIEFQEELATLRKGNQVSRNNRLAKLYPFVDPDDGILRVGGRLHARAHSLSQETLYPAILTKKSDLSYLLAYKVHRDTLHGGLHLCVAELRRSHWTISARKLCRELIRKCVRCFRFNSKPLHALMGDLPKKRITPSKPFTHTALDHAGPIAHQTTGGTQKVYLAL